MKEFELTIPKEYLSFINQEIKKPRRPNTENLELWLERELNIENPGAYGNMPTDESHVTIHVLPNGLYKVQISDVCFNMITSSVQPEPHSHNINNEDALHVWLDLRTNKVKSKEHIKVKEISKK